MVGNYTVALAGAFEFSNGADSKTEYVYFNVSLEAPTRTYVPDADHFYFQIEDQSVDLDEGLAALIVGAEPILGKYRNVMNIDVDLGEASSFASYNYTTKTLTIEQGSLTQQDVGSYTITVLASYSDETYSEYYS